ncbi:replication initiation protein [Peptoniphilaceae bacterium SGI.131]
MVKTLVKYHNDLNSLSIRNWTNEEMNFFFSVIAKIRDIGTQEIVFSTNEIKEMVEFNDRHYRWIKVLDSIGSKVINLKYIERSKKKIAYFAIFQKFVIDIEKEILNIKVAEDFEYIINKLTANFTVYELAEFTSLKSTYSKTMYRILKQWKSLGEKEFKIDQLRTLLDIPDSYNISAINRQIIKPIEKELLQYFSGLKIKAIKKNTKGTPVIGYRLSWNIQKSNYKFFDSKKNNTKKHRLDPDNRLSIDEKKKLIQNKIHAKHSFKPPIEEEIIQIDGQIEIDELID